MLDLEPQEVEVDTILRTSGPRLRAAIAQQPVADFRRPRGSRRRGWIIAVATVVVLVAGLVAIGTNRNDQSVGDDSSRLYWELTELPADLPLVHLSQPGTQVGEPGATVMVNVYATDAAPLGPILSVAGSDGSVGQDIVPVGGSNFEETTIGGRRAAFADAESGARLLYIEVDGRWVMMTSRDIDDVTLTKMAQSVVREPGGTALVPESDLLDDLTLVLPSDAPLSDLFVGSDFSGIDYTKGDGRSLSLQVYPSRPSSAALLGLQTALTPVKVQGANGFTGGSSIAMSVPHVDVRILSWERDGLELRLTGYNVTDTEMMAAAEAAEHVSAARWNEMLRQTGGSLDQGAAVEATAPAGTEPAVQAPPDTVPALQGEAHDVEIEVSVVDSSANEQIWSGTLPTGEAWTVNVTRVYDSISTRPEVDGVPQGMNFGALARPDGQHFSCCAPLNVITADSNATAMRVTTHHGERFEIPLHSLPGVDGLRIALIALPGGGGPELAELVDAEGNVLESLAGGT